MTEHGAVDESPSDDERAHSPLQRQTGYDEDEDEAPRSSVSSPEPPASTAEEANTDASVSESGSETVQVPWKFREAKKGREAKNIYVNPDDAQRLKQLRHAAEDEFDDDNVRKLDVYAAVIAHGLDDFDGSLDKLREWGYGKSVE